jgi:hypothetical protein
MGTAAIDQLMKEVDIDTKELEVVKNPLYLISEEGWEQQVDVEKLRADHSLAIKTAMWRAIHDLTNKYYKNNAPSSSRSITATSITKRKADDDGLDFLIACIFVEVRYSSKLMGIRHGSSMWKTFLLTKTYSTVDLCKKDWRPGGAWEYVMRNLMQLQLLSVTNRVRTNLSTTAEKKVTDLAETD